MAKRRKMTGTPLLLASAGIVLGVGCSGGNGGVPPVVTGNLMPPPRMEVCVDTTPTGATVELDGTPTSQRCTQVDSYREILLQVSAPGYAMHEENLPVGEDGKKVEKTIALIPDKPVAPPVGNLMPPPKIPPPPPVGNLMPPPDLDPPEAPEK